MTKVEEDQEVTAEGLFSVGKALKAGESFSYNTGPI